MSDEKFDLTGPRGRLTVHSETNAELDARLAQDKLELEQKLHIQRVTFYVMLALYVVALCTASVAVFLTPDAELRKWLTTVVSLLLGGGAGFFTGKNSKG